jgi:hypothetical protein
VRPFWILAVTPAEAVDQPVAGVENQTPREEARRGPSVSERLLDCLVDEVERDRADQDTSSEPHDQPDHTQREVEEERDQGADDKRGARQKPPTERSTELHLAPRLRSVQHGDRALSHRASVNERLMPGLHPIWVIVPCRAEGAVTPSCFLRARPTPQPASRSMVASSAAA